VVADQDLDAVRQIASELGGDTIPVRHKCRRVNSPISKIKI
jgi:hypothetical protein